MSAPRPVAESRGEPPIDKADDDPHAGAEALPDGLGVGPFLRAHVAGVLPPAQVAAPTRRLALALAVFVAISLVTGTLAAAACLRA